MKQKTLRGLSRKVPETIQFGKCILPGYAFRKRSKKNNREADGRVPPVRFEYSKEAAALDGAREPRWSPAAIHGEAGGSGGTYGY